ncbi:MAG: hypothetical protein MHMPM18_002710 [Marteilia pararefringens]
MVIKISAERANLYRLQLASLVASLVSLPLSWAITWHIINAYMYIQVFNIVVFFVALPPLLDTLYTLTKFFEIIDTELLERILIRAYFGISVPFKIIAAILFYFLLHKQPYKGGGASIIPSTEHYRYTDSRFSSQFYNSFIAFAIFWTLVSVLELISIHVSKKLEERAKVETQMKKSEKNHLNLKKISTNNLQIFT